MQKTETEALLQKLLQTSSIGRFFTHFEGVETFPSFAQYISNLSAEKNVSPAAIIKKADIERTYGHQLFNGTKSPSRDKVLMLAFGFGMDYESTQKLLAIARKSALHPKVKRDAVVIFALTKGLGINAVQATLYDLGLPILGKERCYE